VSLTKQQLKQIINEEIVESFDSMMKGGNIAAINQAIDFAMSMEEVPYSKDVIMGDTERAPGNQWLMIKYTGPPRTSADYEAYKSEKMADVLKKWLEKHGIFKGGGPTRAEPKDADVFYWSNYTEPQQGDEAYTKVWIQKTRKKNET